MSEIHSDIQDSIGNLFLFFVAFSVVAAVPFAILQLLVLAFNQIYVYIYGVFRNLLVTRHAVGGYQFVGIFLQTDQI